MLETNSMGGVNLGIKIVMGPDDVAFGQRGRSSSMFAQVQDQDDEIARLQHKLNEDQAKLAEAQKAKADMHHFAANQKLATETQGGQKYTLEDMVNDKSPYPEVNAWRAE